MRPDEMEPSICSIPLRSAAPIITRRSPRQRRSRPRRKVTRAAESGAISPPGRIPTTVRDGFTRRLSGPASDAAKFAMTNGAAPHGSIVAFKVEAKNGKPSLVPQWISRDLLAPASPITTNGLVFALSTGQSPRLRRMGVRTLLRKGKRWHRMRRCTCLTEPPGKNCSRRGDDAATFSHGSGLAIANGRVYFTTHDNTVYCYGFPAMQPQLTER